jgi:hypothetical protein
MEDPEMIGPKKLPFGITVDRPKKCSWHYCGSAQKLPFGITPVSFKWTLEKITRCAHDK